MIDILLKILNDFFLEILSDPTTWTVLSAVAILSLVAFAAVNPRLFLLVVKNLRRNVLRTSSTCAATMVLVLMVTMIWTIVFAIDRMTREKSADFKLILSERWQLPSMMPPTHAKYLDPESPQCAYDPKQFGITGKDFMTWSFYFGTTSPGKLTLENMAFFFVMEPRQIIPMMDDMENFDPALVKKLEETPNGCLLGKDRMRNLDKKVGERFKVTCLNFKGVDLDFEIVGELPAGRYDLSGIMNSSYLNNAMDSFAAARGGKRHEFDHLRLNYVWIRVRDQATFNQLGEIIENSRYLSDRPVKVETGSSGLGAFLDAYRDLLGVIKYLVVPAILISMALVVANAISISVRERRTEMAVLKVLGFRPGQILLLVLGESLLVSGVSGLAAAGLAYCVINFGMGGVKFPIGFFPAFLVPGWAVAWGLIVGYCTGLLGSFLPAWTVRSVKVSEVFAKVA